MFDIDKKLIKNKWKVRYYFEWNTFSYGHIYACKQKNVMFDMIANSTH